MNDTAQIILAIGTLVTALSTLILGIVNRNTINTVKTQTDGMLAGMQIKAEELGHAKGKADEIQYQRDNPPAAAPGIMPTDEPVKVEITKIPPLKP